MTSNDEIAGRVREVMAARLRAGLVCDEGVRATVEHMARLRAAEAAPVRARDRADVTAWRVTLADLDAVAGREVTPAEAERIGRAIEYSSVQECINGAVEQVCGFPPEPDELNPCSVPELDT